MPSSTGQMMLKFGMDVLYVKKGCKKIKSLYDTNNPITLNHLVVSLMYMFYFKLNLIIMRLMDSRIVSTWWWMSDEISCKLTKYVRNQ